MISSLVAYVLILATLGFFAWLGFKESKDLKLDNDTLFKSLYNYRHTSGGTVQINTGEIKSG